MTAAAESGSPEIDVERADTTAADRRRTLWRSATPSAPPPSVNAEWLSRQMARHELTAVSLSKVLGITGARVGQWMEGQPIPLKRQRELMDLFGEPLNLCDATLEELLREVLRRVGPAATLTTDPEAAP